MKKICGIILLISLIFLLASCSDRDPSMNYIEDPIDIDNTTAEIIVDDEESANEEEENEAETNTNMENEFNNENNFISDEDAVVDGEKAIYGEILEIQDGSMSVGISDSSFSVVNTSNIDTSELSKGDLVKVWYNDDYENSFLLPDKIDDVAKVKKLDWKISLSVTNAKKDSIDYVVSVGDKPEVGYGMYLTSTYYLYQYIDNEFVQMKPNLMFYVSDSNEDDKVELTLNSEYSGSFNPSNDYEELKPGKYMLRMFVMRFDSIQEFCQVPITCEFIIE